MKKLSSTIVAFLALGAAFLPAACSDSSTSPNSSGTGALSIKLTDAPFLTDSVSRVDVFVVRVDARVSDADSATADHAITADSASSAGWKTVGSPNATINLLALQNGVTAALGQANLAAGSYSGFRLIIDPAQSSVTLKDGRVLTGVSDPGIKFPSANKSGLKIVIAAPVLIVAGKTTELLVDFNINDSFVMRGNSVHNNGLLFKPVIQASVTNLGLTNATIKLVNATGTALDFRQNGTILTGGGAIAYGTGSSCSSVNATTPALTVTLAGSATALAGFTPTFVSGTSYTVVAYPNATGGVQFATLSNAFTLAAGQSGFRVFNASGAVTGYDVFLTANGAVLGAPSLINVLTGTGSAFVSVPAGSSQVRLTTTALPIVLLDLGVQTFTAGQTTTVIVAPPNTGSTTLRGFVVPNC